MSVQCENKEPDLVNDEPKKAADTESAIEINTVAMKEGRAYMG